MSEPIRRNSTTNALLLPLLVAFAVAGILTGGVTAASPVFVGILRPDGLLVPIAIHDGSNWWNAWPFSYRSDESVARLPLPHSLERVPAEWLPPGVTLPVRWRVQLQSGRRTVIRLRRPMRPEPFSLAAMIAILTDYPVDRSRPGREYDDNEIGVAVAGDVEAGSFAQLPPRETRLLTEAIRPLIDHAETAEILSRIKENQSQPDGSGLPIAFPADARQRAVTPVNADFIRASRTENGRTYFYFSGGKRYGTALPPDCDADVAFSGVVIRERDGRIHSPAISAHTTLDCSSGSAISMAFRPLATLYVGRRMLWVVRNDAEGGFDYGVVDPSATDVHVMPMRGSWQLREHDGR